MTAITVFGGTEFLGRRLVRSRQRHEQARRMPATMRASPPCETVVKILRSKCPSDTC